MNRFLFPLMLILIASTSPLFAQAPACCNILTNGDFEQGNVGFTSDLPLNCGCEASSYCVNTNFQTKCGGWQNVPDHTTGAGNFLIVDGNDNSPVPVDIWQINTTITNGADYCFSFWVASQYDTPFDLGLAVNGTLVPGAVFNVQQGSASWTQYTFNFTATSPGSNISIQQLLAGSFQDFGIDDIEFGQELEAKFAASPNISCGTDVQFFSQSTGPAPLTYLWSFGDLNSSNNSSTLQNPIHNFTECGDFEVCLTIRRGACMNTYCQTISVTDDELPAITCPPNVSVSASPPSCATAVNGIKWLTATDNCGVPTVSYSVNGGLPGQNDASGTVFPDGTSTVSYTATDKCGNTKSCTFQVKVICQVICDPTCPANLVTNPGFENGPAGFPNAQNQINSCTGWGNANNSGSVINQGDWYSYSNPVFPGFYFNVSNTPLPPHCGSKYAGFNPNNCEGISTMLTMPIPQGCPYEVGFWWSISTAPTVPFSFFAVLSGGVCTMHNNGSSCSHTCGGDQHVIVNVVPGTHAPGVWYFHATTINSAYPNVQNITFTAAQGQPFANNYIFIDDVCVSKVVEPCSVTAGLECFPAINPTSYSALATLGCGSVVTQVDWYFDGAGPNPSSSNLISVVHPFTTLGIHKVCLVVTASNDGGHTFCRDTFCKNVDIIRVPPTKCDSVGVFWQKLRTPEELCCYALQIDNMVPNCFNQLEVTLSSGDFVNAIFDPSWNVVGNPLSGPLYLTPSGGGFIPTGYFNLFTLCLPGGTNPHVLNVNLLSGLPPSVDTCHWDFTYTCFEPPADSCCLDYDIFCQNVMNAVNITVDNANCKATLNIGDLPGCDYLEWVNWGDGVQDYGPFVAGAMPMHTYSGSGTFVISYLAIEVNPHTGLICFEKILKDTIVLNCACCKNYNAFLAAAAAVQTNGVLGDCTIGFQATGLTNCMQITYNWGHGTPTGPITGNNVVVSHTYPGTGTYYVCYTIQEVNNGMVCWEYTRCDSVYVICSSGPCEVSITVTPIPNSCSVQVTATTTGPQPVTYQWCDGNTGASYTTQPTPCVPVIYCVTATCADGSTSTATVVYTLPDLVPPVAVCNFGIALDLGASCSFQVTPAFVDGGSTDNCGIQSMSVSPTLLLACTMNIVTLTVTDHCGNTSTCSMDIETAELVPPMLDCPPNLSVQGTINPQGICTGVYQPDKPPATDNCDPSVSITHDIPGVLQSGPTIVTWTATDNCGNTTTCIQIVTVDCCAICPAGTTAGPELVVDGNFENNIAFNSDYVFATSCSPGIYNVATGPQLPTICGEWGGLDHTFGTTAVGHMLAVDGNQTPGLAAWRQQVTILPSRQYAFCAYINNLNVINFPDQPDPVVEVWLVGSNGQPGMLIQNSLPESPDGWVNITALWTAPTSVSPPYNLEIRTSGTSFGGNNFAIDDISFRECQPADTCVCGDFYNMSYRLFQGAPNFNISCGDTLSADCKSPIFWTLGGSFMCLGANCPPTTQMYWELTGPSGSAPQSGSMMASPGFGISFPPYYFGVSGQYQLTFLAICGSDTCRCNFVINATCPPCPDCPGNIVKNPGFFDGAVEGELGGTGSTNNWTAAAGTPDLSSGIYCCDPYAVQMWGSQDLGEAICQAVNFTAGKTYTVSFEAHFYPDPNLTTPYVQFEFLASNGCVDPFTNCGGCASIGISQQISNPGCVNFTLPNWSPGSNSYTHLIIRALNANNFPDISFGRIDNICIQECDGKVLHTGLVGSFPFDNAGDDISQTNISGTVNGATTTTGHNNVTNSAYQFNGSSDWIDCGASPRVTTNAVSVCAWVKTSEPQNGQWVAGQYDGLSGDNGYLLAISDATNSTPGQASFSGRDGTNVYQNSGYSATLVNDGAWHCLVGTAGGSQWKIYVDGSLESTSLAGSTTLNLTTSVYPFTIGRHSDPSTSLPQLWMNGDIDNVRVYNRVLTECEVDLVCMTGYVPAKEPRIETSFRIYPNPNPGIFTVELPEAAAPGMMFRITDLAGRLVKEQETDAGSKQQTVQAVALPDGLYFLQVVSDGKVLAVEKFVKQ